LPPAAGRYSPSSSLSPSGGFCSQSGRIGVEITYRPDAQFPKSISLQRSLQNG
jgi:hypothetical protein